MSQTLKEIAAELGLSVMSVSRALHGQTGVSEETRQRVRSVARARGYRPNPAARALVTGKTQTVALWMSQIDQPYYARVMAAMRALTRRDGYEMLLWETDAGADTIVGGWPVDGILALDGSGIVDAYVQGEGERRPPVAALGASPSRSTDFVSVDLEAGTEEALDHLAALGCRRIAYLPVAGFEIGDPRYKRYLEWCARTGRTPEFLPAAAWGRAHAQRAIHDHAAAHGLPDGLLCINDYMALGAYRALRDLGVRLPEDLALIGCDGLEELEYLDTPVSSIVQPIEAMCAQAWDFLQRRLAEPGAAWQASEMPARLVVRASSRRTD